MKLYLDSERRSRRVYILGWLVVSMKLGTHRDIDAIICAMEMAKLTLPDEIDSYLHSDHKYLEITLKYYIKNDS